MENVVQLEFFHVGGRGDGDIEALRAECAERRASGSPLKTVVRLYDEGQMTVRFLRKWKLFRRYLRKVKYLYEQSSGFRRFLIGKRYMKLISDYSDEAELQERLEFAQRFFAERSEEWEDIAVENSYDHTFRPMQDDEVYDLCTAISKAKNAWIFVFAPNDLCADKNTGVMHAM